MPRRAGVRVPVVRVTVTLTEGEHERLRREADATSGTLSDVLRSALLSWLSRASADRAPEGTR
jgi:hypothetical protein